MTRVQTLLARPVIAPLAAALAVSLLTACTSAAGSSAAADARISGTTVTAVAPNGTLAIPSEQSTAVPTAEPPPELEPTPGPLPVPAPAPKPRPLWPPGATVSRGDKGAVVLALQRRLSQLGYDPGRQDSVLGMQTRQALWAFQHVNNVAASGEVDAATSAALTAPRAPAVLAAAPVPDRVEVNIGKQYAVVYLGGKVRVITHISSGSGRRWCEKDLTGALRCASGRTPKGTFKVRAELHAWRTSYLGKLYKPAYFKGGYALHGSLSVPNGAASHGCVRIPMHVAEYLVDLTEIGMPVIVV